MVKRAVAGLLWFFSIWVAYDLIWSLTGIPRSVGPILRLVAAVIVVIDPTGLCWGKPFALAIAAPSRQRVERRPREVPPRVRIVRIDDSGAARAGT